MRKLATFLLLVLASSSTLPAAPALTTIQDILYKADGTRFNGTLTIQWTNFQSSDTSIVATQQLTLQIVNGVLKVQLVPTTNASAGANYAVNYQSAGRFQFTETWAVPPSNASLKVRDVRVSSGTVVGGGTTPVTGGQLQISDIQGLTNELLVRPIRGAGFAPARAAFINTAGQIEGVQGNLGDCVAVDGSSVPCGNGTSGASVFGETPGGTVNGSNAVFSLVNPPAPQSSLQLYRNGLLMSQNIDYTLSTNQITFLSLSVPQTGDTLVASYQYTPAGSIIGNQTASTGPHVLCNGTGGTAASTSLAILGTCNIGANKLVAGDRLEIKFGFTHQGTASGFKPSVFWGGTALVLRTLNSIDTAMTGEAEIVVASDGALTHFTTSTAALGLPIMTSGGVPGNIQNPNTVAFDGALAGAGTSDSISLKFYTITRYPAPQ